MGWDPLHPKIGLRPQPHTSSPRPTGPLPREVGERGLEEVRERQRETETDREEQGWVVQVEETKFESQTIIPLTFLGPESSGSDPITELPSPQSVGRGSSRSYWDF